MIFLGVLLTGFCIYGLCAPGTLTAGLPSAVWWASLFFALFVVGISSIGMCGAQTQSKCGLGVYIFVVFLCVVAQFAAFGYVMVKLGYIKDADAAKFALKSETSFGKTFTTTVSGAEWTTEWKQFQDESNCCGYDLKQAVEGPYITVASILKGSDALNSGEACTNGYAVWAGIAKLCKAASDSCDLKARTDEINTVWKSASANTKNSDTFFCESQLVAMLKKYINYIAGAAGALAFFELICLVSASRLACCISVKDGGHMEHWRPATRGGDYTANDLTGTSGGNFDNL